MTELRIEIPDCPNGHDMESQNLIPLGDVVYVCGICGSGRTARLYQPETGAISNALAEVSNDVVDQKAEVQQIVARQTSMSSLVQQLAQVASTVQNAMGTADQIHEHLQDEVDQLTQDVSTAESHIVDHETRLSAVVADEAALHLAYNDFVVAYNSAMSVLLSRLAGDESNISTLQTSFATLGQRLDALVTTVNGHTTSIGQLSTAATALTARVVTLEVLPARVTVLEALPARVTALEALPARVSTLESKVGALEARTLARQTAVGSGAVPAMLLGAVVSVVCTLDKTMIGSYTPMATLVGGSGLIGKASIEGITAMTATSITVQVKAALAVAAGGYVNVQAVGA